MSLKSKIIGIMVAAMVFNSAAGLSVLKFAIYPNVLEHERQEALQDAGRVRHAITRELHHLDGLCHDWAAWDETCDFVQNRSEKYVRRNIPKSAFEDNQLNLIYFIDTQQAVVWKDSFDPSGNRRIALKDFPKEVFPRNHPLLDFPSGDIDLAVRRVSGLFNTEYGPMLIASRPIITGNNTGPVRGTLIMGRFFTGDLANILRAQTGVNFSIEDLFDPGKVRAASPFSAPGALPETYRVDDSHAGLLRAFTIFPGLGKAPGIRICIEKPRTLAAKTGAAMRFAVLAILTVGLVLIAMTWGLIQRTLLGPIHQLTRHMIDVARTGDLSARLKLKRNDEIGAMGTGYDAMLSLLEKKSRELVRANTALKADVDKRKRAEKALAESETRYRTLFERAGDAIFILKAEGPRSGMIVGANLAAATIHGYGQDELLAMDIRKLFPPEGARGVDDRIARMVAGEWVHDEVTHLRRDGTAFPVEISAGMVELGGRKFIFAFDRDISDRKKAEEERLLLATAIEQSPELVYITDTRGRIEYVNPAFESATGFSRAGVIGEPPSVFKEKFHAGVASRSIWKHLKQGRSWKGRMTNRRQNGEPFEVQAAISPVKNSTGSVIKYICTERDVTEEIRLEDQLRRVQKMEAIGTLAGGVAHDFNNILSGIIGFTQIAMMDLPEGTPAQSNLKKVLAAGARAGELVKQILAFSRQSEKENKPVPVKPIVKEALKLCRASLPSFIDIRQCIESESAVMGDSTQIHQIVMNLCTNAGHAMEAQGGVLRVGLHELDVDADTTGPYADAAPGRFIKISVSDTGEGIPEIIMERIFDPFFTTKAKGKGTGLGLSAVHGIARSHGGFLTVDNRPGKGATFNVFLPAIESGDGKEAEPDPPFATGSERILFIDDEAFQVDLGLQILGRLGYRVETETDSIKALRRFRKDPGAFDLVITDMTMPIMTGDTLGQTLLKIRPDIPVIVCTGYSERMTEARAEALGFKGLAMKPMVVKEIAGIVREVLDGKTRWQK